MTRAVCAWLIPPPKIFPFRGAFKAIHERALELCHGRILDVGAGAARDALQLRQMELDVLPIDVEPPMRRDYARSRIINRQLCGRFLSNFDTIIISRLTIGLAGRLEQLVHLLGLLAQLLNRRGQILLDSMARGISPATPITPASDKSKLYYGRFAGAILPWLYDDYDVLKTCAKK